MSTSDTQTSDVTEETSSDSLSDIIIRNEVDGFLLVFLVLLSKRYAKES